MLTYDKALAVLRENADEEYKRFHGRLLKNDRIQLIGVRIPVLRKIAKEWKGELEALLAFPDEYYEITFLKCTVVSALPYGQFVKRVDGVVALLDNWATCDCFKARCIAKHKQEFLPFIEKYFASEAEFTKRYALVTLLSFYVEEEHLPLIFSYLLRCKSEKYYVRMAAAWLLAEVLVKFYVTGREFLREKDLDGEVKRKGIQKACESFRLTKEQKADLRTYKS